MDTSCKNVENDRLGLSRYTISVEEKVLQERVITKKKRGYIEIIIVQVIHCPGGNTGPDCPGCYSDDGLFWNIADLNQSRGPISVLRFTETGSGWEIWHVSNLLLLRASISNSRGKDDYNSHLLYLCHSCFVSNFLIIKHFNNILIELRSEEVPKKIERGRGSYASDPALRWACFTTFDHRSSPPK